MKKTFEPEDVEKLLAEADELIRQISSEAAADVDEEQRSELEEHARRLEQLKSEVHQKVGKQETATSISHGEGIHEAIQDIVKAMKSLKSYFS
ncbi:MAG: hypothetical protein ABSE08_12250 [Syntrophobacteraceae bacterium]|jgi:hypothetical protein